MQSIRQELCWSADSQGLRAHQLSALGSWGLRSDGAFRICKQSEDLAVLRLGRLSSVLRLLPQALGVEAGFDDGPQHQHPDSMKLPEGWRVWLFVIGLNAMAAGLWFVDRGVERPAPGGSLWQVLRSLVSGG